MEEKRKYEEERTNREEEQLKKLKNEIFDGIKRLKQRKIYYTTNNSVMIFLNNLELVNPGFLFNPYSKIRYLRAIVHSIKLSEEQKPFIGS